MDSKKNTAIKEIKSQLANTKVNNIAVYFQFNYFYLFYLGEKFQDFNPNIYLEPTMIIKNLWVIAKVGLCYYHYTAPYSDYQIDENLFSGFVAGLSHFADSLSAEHKSLEYLKMGEDELYFETIGEIIVATIVMPREEKLQPFSIKVMLQFVGTKFLELFMSEMEDLSFDWIEINELFTNEINAFLQDKELLEEIKREQLQNLFNDVINSKIPLDIFHWRSVQLFADSDPLALKNAIDLLENLLEVASNLITDKILQAKISEILYRLMHDLGESILKHDPKVLFIVCEKTELFNILSNIFLVKGIKALHSTRLDYLIEKIAKWNNSTPFDILVIENSVTPRMIKTLHNLNMDPNVKIIMVVNKIPRPPRGRINHRHAISFIVQEDISSINRKSPLVDYILTHLIQE